ncbi:Wadjet anti-phage system protein JetD domain-containing protein [Streptomyces sp. NBC_01477]|uniref:Wadjet anti-phage system protein JetD domain-containing protein n=1 Tax=Streptomyces sp. NBC_01477 TaxID=2976015 RepID=UPI002E33443C|nr:Wadjet anti-phage system protein JetD domain-containing protein [Streptomyces sp. NBC_01477]
MALPRRESELIAGLREWAAAHGRSPYKEAFISLDAVWEVFRRVPHRNVAGAFEPAVLVSLLNALDSAGLIRQVQRRTPDKVSLPVKVRLLPQAQPPAVPPMPRWHPVLTWLAEEWATATVKQRPAYAAIDRWLKSGPDLFRIPLRERALEIFGTFGSAEDFLMPEKTLDDLKSGPLFSDQGRLDQLLHAFRPPLPLITETFPLEDEDGRYCRVGTGDVLFVVENATTWWSLVESLPGDHRLGYVAWGLGGTFRASIRAIKAKHRITQIRYFGDLDTSGLRIPLRACDTAAELGLPPVQPAEHLYRALQLLGRPRPATAKEASITAATAGELAQWLPAPCQERGRQLLLDGQRLAQEWVTYRYLRQNCDWHDDVR